MKIAMKGILGALLMGLAYLAVQWWTLPGKAETLRLASTVHFNVEKRLDEKVVKLTGNGPEFSLNTSLEKFPAVLVDAVIASEDRRFHAHGTGYKLAKFAQALLNCSISVATGHSMRGCPGNSTITQQVARLLLIGNVRTPGRKLSELIWAIKMERLLTKEQILQIYLNRVPLGGRIYGFDMAARQYFGKYVSQVDLPQAALLVASVRRPSANWERNPAATIHRANIVLDAMTRHGFLAGPLQIASDYSVERGPVLLSRPFFGHIWSWLRPRVEQILSAHPAGVYKVNTSINAEVQIYAQRSIRTVTQSLQHSNIPASQGAVMVMRPSGNVLAMIGGADNSRQSRYFNRAIPVRGLRCRPPASLMKLVLYTAALERGIALGDLIDATPFEFEDAAGKIYRPDNHDGKVYSMISLLEAYVHSVNTAAVRLLAETVRFEKWFEVAGRFGLPVDRFPRELGLALGQPAVCMVDMIRAYAIVASGGFDSRPQAILELVDGRGRVVFETEHESKRIFSRSVMRNMQYLSTQVIQRGTGVLAKKNLSGVVIGGKTGTSDGFLDAWFIGYTKDLVVGVWIGNDMPTAMPQTYGGNSSALVFNQLMSYLLKHTSVVDREPEKTQHLALSH